MIGKRRVEFCSWRMLSPAGQASAKLRQFFVEDDNILDEQEEMPTQTGFGNSPALGGIWRQFPKQQRRGISGRKRRVELKLHPYRSVVNIEAQCLQPDGLAALVAGGYHEDGSFQLLGHEVQIAFCLVRQLLEAGYALGDFLPAGKLPVNRFAVL